MQKYKVVAVVFILLVTFFAYFPCLHHEFTNWDDDNHLTGNLAVRALDAIHLKEIFTQIVQGVYVPLTILSFAFEYHFFEYQPFIYHLDNILLHLGVTVLIFIVGMELGLSLWAALAAMLLFGLHPIHVESVAWITERKDVLYSFFYLLAIFFFCRSIKGEERKFYFLSLFMGFLSILAKPMALSLPFILAICEWKIKGRFNFRMLISKWPYFLYIIPVTWLTYNQNMRIPGRDVTEAFMIWIWSLSFYIRKFLFPYPLTPLYELPEPVSIFQYEYFLAVIFILLIGYCLYRFRKNSWLLFSFFIYFFSIFFLLRFDNKVDPSTVADRFMYLPCFGFCFLFGFSVEKLWESVNHRRIVQWTAAALFVLLFGTFFLRTNIQTKIWKNSQSLWEYVILYNKNNSRVFHNLGETHMKEGKFQQARLMFDRSIELDPRAEESYINLGFLEGQEGRLDGAVQYFEKAKSVNPHSVAAYNNLGNVYSLLGQWDKAEENFQEALNNNPMYLQPRYNLAGIYLNQQRYPEAEKTLKNLLIVDPGNEFAFLKLTELYMTTGRKQDAVALGKKILAESKKESLLTNMGSFFALHNFSNLAVAFYQKSLKVNPAYVETYLELGKFYGNLEDFSKARDIWKEGKKVAPYDQRFNDLIIQAEALAQQKKL